MSGKQATEVSEITRVGEGKKDQIEMEVEDTELIVTEEAPVLLPPQLYHVSLPLLFDLHCLTQVNASSM